MSLADLQKNEDEAYRVIKLRVEDVQGRNCLTNFYGMDFTTDKLKSLVRKWQSLIETHVDIKTTDNYVLRLFCIGFTKKRPNARRVTWYAKSSQLKQIRRKMVQIMTREASNVSLRDLVEKLYARVFFLALLTPCSIPNGIGKQIERECQGIYPLQNVYIRKVKVMKAPKFDRKIIESV